MMEQQLKRLRIITVLTLFCLSAPVWAKGDAAAVSANKFATAAGMRVLSGGGSAADAAIAMAFTLGVAEPYNSGMGGGGFLLYYEKARNQFVFVDYREVAPALAKNEDYVKAGAKNGQLSETGGLAIAVPGFVAGMQTIHDRFGKKPWDDLLNDAVTLARSGYRPSALFLKKLEQEKDRLSAQENFQLFFTQPATAKDPLIRMENLALTMEKIQRGGAEEFYRGALSQVILKELAAAGSKIAAEDFNYYHVHFRKPYEFLFRDLRVVSAPLPSTGGLFLEQVLRASNEEKVKSGTPAFTKFLAAQLKLYFEKRYTLADVDTNILGQTTHLCAIDSEGNIAAMTNTINSAFGSGVVLPGTGLILNNEMDDFHFDPKIESKNRIAYRNRPLSSMSPTIVFRGFDPILAIGTPGGLTIPINLFQVLQRHLLEGDSLAASIAAPKFYSFPHQNVALYEKGFAKKNLNDDLDPKPTEAEKPVGNVQAISITKGVLKTVSDPRGEGAGQANHQP